MARGCELCQLLCVCVNQRLFITNTGPPRGVYTCPHKVGYGVTLPLLVVYIYLPYHLHRLYSLPPPLQSILLTCCRCRHDPTDPSQTASTAVAYNSTEEFLRSFPPTPRRYGNGRREASPTPPAAAADMRYPPRERRAGTPSWGGAILGSLCGPRGQKACLSASIEQNRQKKFTSYDPPWVRR